MGRMGAGPLGGQDKALVAKVEGRFTSQNNSPPIFKKKKFCVTV